MKTRILILLLVFFQASIFSQSSIKGKIVDDENQALEAAVISFTPQGGTEDNQHCSWRINCRHGVATLSFERFATERGYDFVSLYDGRDTQADQLAHVSGRMTSLEQLTYTSSGPMMVVQFDSDISKTQRVRLFRTVCRCSTYACHACSQSMPNTHRFPPAVYPQTRYNPNEMIASKTPRTERVRPQFHR